MMSLTSQLTQLILTSPLNRCSLIKARYGLVDWCACIWPIYQQTITDPDWQILCQIYAQSKRTSEQALLLAYASHALDFDDFLAPQRGHPSTVVWSALIAYYLTNLTHSCSYQQLLEAYVIGIETAGRLGLAAGAQHYLLGFHNTATLGSIAAVAALGRLLRLRQETLANALGIAATQAAGLRAQFGTAVKPLHAGFAARLAIEAIKLAKAGFSGQRQQIIESFLSAHGDHVQNLAKLTKKWGQPWLITKPGLEFKLYPTCGGTHGAIKAAQLVSQQLIQNQINAQHLLSQSKHITLIFPLGADTAPYIRQPSNYLEARFSLEYVVADVLLHGKLSWPDYLTGPLKAVTLTLASKVKRQVDLTFPTDAQAPQQRFHQLQLELIDRRIFTARVTRAQMQKQSIDLIEKMQRLNIPADYRAHAKYLLTTKDPVAAQQSVWQLIQPWQHRPIKPVTL